MIQQFGIQADLSTSFVTILRHLHYCQIFVNFGRSVFIMAVLFFLIAPVSVNSRAYFIDSENGSNSNDGRASTNPIKTIDILNQQRFNDFDTIFFKRGCRWNQGLKVYSNNPLKKSMVITAYGKGNAPILSDSTAYAITIFTPFVQIESLYVCNSGRCGIFITQYSNNCLIQDCEITNCGSGIELQGPLNVAQRNYIHDLKMILNTPGGNDDYGAVGIWLENKCNRVAFNQFIRCKSASYDYGTDGGAVEFYDKADSCNVYNNIAVECNGFFEVGNSAISNSTISYNISVNNGLFSFVHFSGEYKADVLNFRVENNTIVDTVVTASPVWTLIGFNGIVTEKSFSFRNNIVYIKNFQTVCPADKNNWKFIHKTNLYFFSGKQIPIGFQLDSTEKIADPKFSDISIGNYHLKSISPAIQAGTSLGYSKDYYLNPVPADTPPDIGAIQYVEPVKSSNHIKILQNKIEKQHSILIHNRLLSKNNFQYFDLQGRSLHEHTKLPNLGIFLY